MIGKEFLTLLSEKLPDEFKVKWKLRRSVVKNQLFRIHGIIIVGKLTNKVLGEALGKNVNLILTTSSTWSMYYHEAESEITEYLYKHNVRVLEWSIEVMHNTDLGHIIISKICMASSTWFVYKTTVQALIYESDITIKNILQRLSPFLICSKLSQPDINQFFKIAYFLHSSHIDLDRFNPEDQLLFSIETPTCLDLLLANNNVIVLIQEKQYLNEISRELYYIIKPGQLVPIYLEFNDTDHFSII